MRAAAALMAALLLGALPACGPGADADPDAAFDAWASENAIPLATVEPSDDDADLRALDSIVGDARLIALGEPAHGAHEPLALRNRLFRWLVERHGFTAIALETAVPESRLMAEYVAGGAVSLDDAIAGLSWGFAAFESNRELLEWMRAYNADPVHTRKLSVYGVDLSLGGLALSVPTMAAIDSALAYVARVDAPAATRYRGAFERWRPLLPGGLPTVAQGDSITALVTQLVAHLERERAAYVERSSEPDFTRAWRNAVNARQADDVLRALPRDFDGGGIPRDAWISMEARDRAMAENALWALEREGEGGRVLVFAHDLHVKSAPTVGGIWSAVAQPPRAMGQFLRDALEEDYLVIGIASAHSRQGILAAARDATSVDAALRRVGLPLFLLDVRAAREHPAAATWLGQPRPLAANFDTQLELAPLEAFDALIYVDTLGPEPTAP